MALSPDEQAAADRAAIAAFGRGAMSVGDKLGAAFTDIASLPARGLVGAANTALRLPNAFGAGIPYFPDNNGLLTSMTPFYDAQQRNGGAAAPAMPQALTSGGPDRAGGPQASVADPAAAVPKAPGAPAAKKAGPAAAPPRDAAPALIPGETGFYMGDQLVPYGTRFDVNGNGGVTQLNNFASTPGAASAGGGGGGAQSAAAMPAAGGGIPYQGQLIDPRGFFEQMAAAQMRYADTAAQRMLAQAGNGSDLGYSAKLRALASVYLNGLAGVGQGGANTFNSASAGMANAQTDAAARMFASQNALKGSLANAGAHVHAADLGFETNQEQNALRQYELESGSVQNGSQVATDPVTKLSMPVPTYAQRPSRAAMAAGNAMPKAYDNPYAQKIPEGAKQTFNGKSYVRHGGKWEAE
jgi:hypothetical protein